ncbi:MAG: hypothetical protein AB1390_12065 [Nitrospirota bacterium]
MTSDILSALRALSLSGREREKVDRAIKCIENFQSRGINSQKDIDENIQEILKAINDLLFITSVDISNIRLMMDFLLRIWESRYYLQ